MLVTQECNFSCSYCYQKKGHHFLDISTIQNTLDCLLPHFAQESFLNFSGGEPLLQFDLIKETVKLVKYKKLKKNIKFSITTNGSLIDEKILQFLRRNKFSLMLSYDGLAQNSSRCENSQSQMVSKIKKLLSSPEIELEIHSVFTPMSIHHLSVSLRHIMELGIQNASLAFSYIHPWSEDQIMFLKNELSRARSFLLSFYKKNASIPIK